jgi:trk system potassium uptake protein
VYVIILGCGRTGSTLALLLKAEGHDVAVIDRSRDSFQRLGREPSIRMLVGHGLDEDLLNKANIRQADAFVSCTSGDNTNIMAAQVARETFRVERVAAKINDPIRADEYRKMGYFTITESAIVAGAMKDWILERDLQPVEDYLHKIPTPK